MTEAPVPSKTTLHCALELSKNSWLLAIPFPDRPQPSLYRGRHRCVASGGQVGSLNIDQFRRSLWGASGRSDA